MPWLKRNLFLICWGVLALALTVLAVFFQQSQKEEDVKITESIEQQLSELKRLSHANPHPDTNNIRIVQDQQRQVQNIQAEVGKFFAKHTIPKLDDGSFRQILDQTVIALRNDAATASVNLPKNYEFSFSAQRQSVTYEKGSLEPMMARLEDVKLLCGILYQSRVHSLDGIRRVMVSSEDREGSGDIISDRPVTNAATSMVRIPYEITFAGFSSQLASVLQGLLAAPRFLVVKNVAVEPAIATETRPAVARSPDDPAPPVEQPRPTPAAPIANPQARVTGKPTSGVTTILNEKLLRITLRLEAIDPATAVPVPVAAADSAPVAPAETPK